MSPALTGVFFTTEPPAKPISFFVCLFFGHVTAHVGS